MNIKEKELIRKMGLVAYHIKAIDYPNEVLEIKKEKIYKNKNISDKEKKEKLGELILWYRDSIIYHINKIKEHIPEIESVSNQIKKRQEENESLLRSKTK